VSNCCADQGKWHMKLFLSHRDSANHLTLVLSLVTTYEYRGRILGRNWDKILKSCPPCYSKSPQLTDCTPLPHPLSKSRLKLVCNVNFVYWILKSENSQDYAQKPQRNCTLMNSASLVKFIFYTSYIRAGHVDICPFQENCTVIFGSWSRIHIRVKTWIRKLYRLKI
jgi:hypothetical protein